MLHFAVLTTLIQQVRSPTPQPAQVRLPAKLLLTAKPHHSTQPSHAVLLPLPTTTTTHMLPQMSVEMKQAPRLLLTRATTLSHMSPSLILLATQVLHALATNCAQEKSRVLTILTPQLQILV